jgi:hypothetical protein
MDFPLLYGVRIGTSNLAIEPLRDSFYGCPDLNIGIFT